MTDIPAGWSTDFGLAPQTGQILAKVRPVKGLHYPDQVTLTWDNGGEGDDFDRARVGWSDGTDQRFADGDLLCWRLP